VSATQAVIFIINNDKGAKIALLPILRHFKMKQVTLKIQLPSIK
jgi:hypothetical protein